MQFENPDLRRDVVCFPNGGGEIFLRRVTFGFFLSSTKSREVVRRRPRLGRFFRFVDLRSGRFFRFVDLRSGRFLRLVGLRLRRFLRFVGLRLRRFLRFVDLRLRRFRRRRRGRAFVQKYKRR